MKRNFSMKHHPLPAVWRDRRDAGRFTELTTFPDDWAGYAPVLRAKLRELMGVTYDPALPLDSSVINSFTHEGITVRNVIYQTRPGLYTTATLYLPKGKGPFPGVINMHGHWQQGRLAARVQSRGIMLAKSGYVVLSPDTFGQGERCTVHGKFEYHGRTLGGHVFDLGETLMGCQLVDNMRGVDLLASLPEVDASRLGATGASGGGNQTMYLAAMDERIKAAVPVCSVGSFDSYLGQANCVCETLPGGLLVTEMAGILALTAPRAMLICTGLYDVKTFSPQEMLRSFDAAMPVFKKLGAAENFTYRIFNQGHAYSPAAREAMLGFFELHLKGLGHGMPKEEPAFTTIGEDKLMAFSPGKRPEKVCSLVRYLQKRGEELLDALEARKTFLPAAERKKLAEVLKLDGSLKISSAVELAPEKGWRRFQLSFTDGRMLPLLVFDGEGEITLFTHVSGTAGIPAEAVEKAVRAGGAAALIDLSHQSENVTEPERVMPYHQTARSLMWLGRTLIGEWTSELCAVTDFLTGKFPRKKIVLHGYREAAAAALFSSVFSDRIAKVVPEEAPVSFAFTKQSDFYGMAFFIPGILKWGDVPLAAALSQAEVVWISPRHADGSPAAAPKEKTASLKSKFKRKG